MNKDQAVREFVRNEFTTFDSYIVTDDYPDEWGWHWKMYGRNGDNNDIVEELEWYEPAHRWWFEIDDGYTQCKIFDDYRDEVIDEGFLLVYHNDEPWGLAIDSIGADFYEMYWKPLYDILGLDWEDEEE